MFIYSDIERENDPHALPDIEIFHNPDYYPLTDEEPYAVGWYWWYCTPGYMPDGEPSGPFDTEEEAIADARENNEQG
ncbi:MAG: hypothetical protein WC910_06730 [Bacteroidales bacterium]|jgi:hypothetical protein